MSALFTQPETGVRTVQIKLGQGRGGSFNMREQIFIRVIGKDTSPDSYKVETYGCQDEDGNPLEQPQSVEFIEANRVTGEYTVLSIRDGFAGDGEPEQSTKYAMAPLKQDADGKLVVDTTKDRVVRKLRQFEVSTDPISGNPIPAFEVNQGESVIITPDNRVVVKQLGREVYKADGSERGYNYTQYDTKFIGSSILEFAVPEGFWKNIANVADSTNEDSGNMEWRNNRYVLDLTSERAQLANSIDFSADPYFSDAIPSIDVSILEDYS